MRRWLANFRRRVTGNEWWLWIVCKFHAASQRWSAMGYDFVKMMHDFKLYVRFLFFLDVVLISIDCPAWYNFEVYYILYKKKMSPWSLFKLFHRHRCRNPPSAAVPCRQHLLPAVWPRWDIVARRHATSDLFAIDSVPCHSHSSIAVVLLLKVVTRSQSSSFSSWTNAGFQQYLLLWLVLITVWRWCISTNPWWRSCKYLKQRDRIVLLVNKSNKIYDVLLCLLSKCK